ncbi:hypothetical protein CHU98_g9605 [Xylaria longipes]|nr:hypothetical protein CHU98_g9605 [Xylaria longipes]
MSARWSGRGGETTGWNDFTGVQSQWELRQRSTSQRGDQISFLLGHALEDYEIHDDAGHAVDRRPVRKSHHLRRVEQRQRQRQRQKQKQKQDMTQAYNAHRHNKPAPWLHSYNCGIILA